MEHLLIIGTGGVGAVVFKKSVSLARFSKITLANRTLSKATKIISEIEIPQNFNAKAVQINADSKDKLLQLFSEIKPDLVINTALPYQNMPIMEACAISKIHYMDTCVPESPDFNNSDATDDEWYQMQWDMDKAFKKANTTAILSMGFDPGVVNAYCAYAKKHLFDSITRIDIMDVNAGKHNRTFATNFNSEINLREVQNDSNYYKNGQFHQVKAQSRKKVFDFPVIGQNTVYSMDHDEVHSLYKHYPEIEHIEFWMGFSENYLNHLNVFKGVGLLSPKPIQALDVNGNPVDIVPVQFLKELLPEPSTLAKEYTGKTCIGCLIKGTKNGQQKEIFIYNICDHEESYVDVKSQAISFTTGVPLACAAALMADGDWLKSGVFNIEELEIEKFLEFLEQENLGHQILEIK